MPDFSNVQEVTHDWESTHGCLAEETPKNAPPSLGKMVQLTHCVDANLMHDVTTGRSVAACLHLANATPIDWHSKKMATVETATCGAEFMAATMSIEQVIDL